jgi:hypothetical protein
MRDLFPGQEVAHSDSLVRHGCKEKEGERQQLWNGHAPEAALARDRRAVGHRGQPEPAPEESAQHWSGAAKLRS